MQVDYEISAVANENVTCSIPVWIDRIAIQEPSAVAIRGDNFAMTYGALSHAANRMAFRLASGGVQAETLVGIALPRSPERIIAMLAVWKAGGAVLFLDPAWPIERLRFLLNDAGSPMVLAPSALVPQLSGAGRTVMGIDADLLFGDGLDALQAGSPAQPAGPLANAAAPDSLAYVVYTSGSTGEPKGVEITHANAEHLIAWHQAVFAVSETDRVSHLAGLGFDASFWEVWPALCSGAAVMLADEQTLTSPVLLQRWLLEQNTTIAFVPTVMAETLVAGDWPATTALRIMLTGGEALRRRPRAGLPFLLSNNYGPSECTVVASSGVIGPDDAAEEPPDIGHAIAGTRLHILDGQGNPVADGEAGEIFIGGAGVGRGYRNRPDLTRERFVPDRFREASGGNLYRTGDRARRLADGRIVYLGRTDAQEQIRGSRVEPEEVSAALSRHPLVLWCTVVGNGPARARRLVAYVLPAMGEPPSSEALRLFLATLLPEPMIPSVFVWIETVPLNANGKLDHGLLPPLADAARLPYASFREPANPAESRLRAIISELLGNMRVGADDNFFLLGGHSLLGTQVVLRANEAFGVQLALRDLFQAPTVAQLAERVTELLAAQLDAMTDAEAEVWAVR
jgi:amino acid adenylation domain-containing protein